jgi:hypothetical protein
VIRDIKTQELIAELADNPERIKYSNEDKKQVEFLMTNVMN